VPDEEGIIPLLGLLQKPAASPCSRLDDAAGEVAVFPGYPGVPLSLK